MHLRQCKVHTMGRCSLLPVARSLLGRMGSVRTLGTSTERDTDTMGLKLRPEQPPPHDRQMAILDTKKMFPKIHTELRAGCSSAQLTEMATYYFDGYGKAVRPVLTMLMARAVNAHLGKDDPSVARNQHQIALICEMWHTSSLLHDDVIDHAESRRGKESVNKRYNPVRSIWAGDYILGVSSKLLAQTGNPRVVMTMAQILADLVNGEFQQMASREESEDRFQLYLDKTFNKTASLMAYSCKAVAILANENKGDPDIEAMAYNYGQNIGIAFQLVDDWLDFVASAEQLGKPAGADLCLGLATAPVLFASQQFPQLNSLILRQFSQPGDVEEAFKLVLDSEGLEQTKLLAAKYSSLAVESLECMACGEDRDGLFNLATELGRRCH